MSSEIFVWIALGNKKKYCDKKAGYFLKHWILISPEYSGIAY